MSEHAVLSPSSAHRWMRCAGSVAATRHCEGSSSSFAREGTAAHTLAQRALEAEEDAEFFRGTEIAVEYTEKGIAKYEMFTVLDEFIDNVQVYLDQVRRQPGHLLVEQKLSMSGVYGVEGQFGTGDAVLLDYEREHLSVHDLKYGQGVMVYAEDNDQLYSYGAAALCEYDVLGDWKTITVAIHQPRLHHYDEHTLTREQLETWMEGAKHVAVAAHALIGCDPDKVEAAKTAGEKQCQWCPIKGNCKVLATWTHEQVYDGFVALEQEVIQVRDPVKIEDDLLDTLVLRADAIEGATREWRAELKRRLEAGVYSGKVHKLVEGRAGARQYADETAAETVLKAARIKQDEMYNMKLISPTQAEKAFAKTKPKVWAKLKALITQKPGAPSVALMSDKRPALETAKSEQFENVEDFGDLV